MSFEIDREALIAAFSAESEENLASVEESVLALEQHPEDDAHIQNIFRAAHTLKGNSSCVGFDEVATVAHAVEDLLDALRSGKRRFDGGVATLLLRSSDVLRELIAESLSGGGALHEVEQQLLDDLRRARRGDAVEERHGEIAAEGSHAPAASRRSLRVDVDKLDRMLNLTGEIAIARERQRQLLSQFRGAAADAVLEAHRESDRQLLELQELVMKSRMVPLGSIFRNLVRVVRDFSRAEDRPIDVVLSGEDVEVDTAIVESLKDPLMHMVRNAIAHGIETPQERAGIGKSERGEIRIEALHQTGSVIIRLSDDGRGIDADAVAERAARRGLCDENARLTRSETYRFLFEPGFSTASEVTDLSGRGVGLDVVRRNVEALRGSISVESEVGCGTTMSVRVPLTLAIIEGFSVGVDDETYVIPLDAVVECVELDTSAIAPRDAVGYMNLRGEVLPLLRLRNVLGRSGTPPARENVIVVHSEAGRAGLVADLLFGEGQTVIKPLGDLFRGIRGVAGSTILGNGRVALIVDVDALVREAVSQEQFRDAAAATEGELP